MLVVEVELLHDAVRASPSTDEAITGHATHGEWPLSPARLFSAFVAADGTGDRCRVTDGEELVLLEQARPPVVLADAATDVCHDERRSRYVVLDATAPGRSAQEYPARTAKLVRPGPWMHPREPRLTYIFSEVEPTDEQLNALGRRAARISYVGCADSPARVRVRRLAPATELVSDDGRTRWEPDAGGTHLPVPYDGLLDVLDHGFAAERAGGVNRRSHLPSRVVGYGDPAIAEPAATGTLLVVGLDRPVSGRRLLRLTETLRSAILAVVGDDAPYELHGHGDPSTGNEQVNYLGLPFVGHRHADGALRGVGVLVPASADAELPRLVVGALQRIDELRDTAIGVRRLEPVDVGSNTVPATLREPRWVGPVHGARVWRTATPVVFERHGHPDLAEVQRWFDHAGLPRPARCAMLRQPLLPGGIACKPSDLRPRYRTYGFSHLAVEFDEPLRGPVVVGRGRQFGLGLMLPDDEVAR